VNWRAAANRAITAALDEGKAKGLEGAELEKHVRANGYPFGERAMHPYKIWCSEVNKVLQKRGVKAKKREDLSGWFNQFTETKS
jgi:hypothetical protein